MVIGLTSVKILSAILLEGIKIVVKYLQILNILSSCKKKKNMANGLTSDELISIFHLERMQSVGEYLRIPNSLSFCKAL